MRNGHNEMKRLEGNEQKRERGERYESSHLLLHRHRRLRKSEAKERRKLQSRVSKLGFSNAV